MYALFLEKSKLRHTTTQEDTYQYFPRLCLNDLAAAYPLLQMEVRCMLQERAKLCSASAVPHHIAENSTGQRTVSTLDGRLVQSRSKAHECGTYLRTGCLILICLQRTHKLREIFDFLARVNGR